MFATVYRSVVSFFDMEDETVTKGYFFGFGTHLLGESPVHFFL